MRKIWNLGIFMLLLLVEIPIGAINDVISNPILPGFHPDPSICRVGDDYYLCTSSFTWFPGLPIYHSRDLVNWELVGHAINRVGMVQLNGVCDKDGIWAPTLRYHNGLFYIFCNVSNGGNFYLYASTVSGTWSDPVWLKDAPGIDPDIFWDDDGKSYMLANQWGMADSKYKDHCVIWIQKINLNSGQLVGERHYLSTGHATNAKNTEAAHLYKIGQRYLLSLSEGGTDFYHAVTLHWADNIFGPYYPQKVNPVLSQRQFGHYCYIQCVGHADLVQTRQGDWYAVTLGKRMINGLYAFTRETFLCPVEIQQNEFIFNPGKGGLTIEIPHPRLPESPVIKLSDCDEFNGDTLQLGWYCERIPRCRFWHIASGSLWLSLLPETLDNLVSPALLMRRITSNHYTATTSIDFSTHRYNEVAGLVLYRNTHAYIALLKTADSLRVIVGNHFVASVAYRKSIVFVRLEANGLLARLSYGPDASTFQSFITVSLNSLAEDGKFNRFNGLGIGLYSSACGKRSKRFSRFDYFKYKDIK